MSELIKRLITAMTLCLTALLVHAQEGGFLASEKVAGQ